jgi:antitoxin HicB
MISYTANFESDQVNQDSGFTVTFLDLPGVITQGDNEPHARAMALDALILLLKHQIATGAPIPRPRKHRGAALRSIPLPALAAAKLELYWAWKASGLSKSDLARRINSPKTNIDRLFNFSHHSRWDIMESAFAALGRRLEINIQPAA